MALTLEDVQKTNKKNVILTIRTTSAKRKWMRLNCISPTKLFTVALKELMEDVKNENKNM